MDLTSFRVPIGVCAGIAPFNFPAMIPLWMFPMGVITGNTYIMKPSERDPGACMALVELLQEAGCPPGKYITMSTEFDKKKIQIEILIALITKMFSRNFLKMTKISCQKVPRSEFQSQKSFESF
jgi:hypothetical protein